jgi:hypothetical protein
MMGTNSPTASLQTSQVAGLAESVTTAYRQAQMPLPLSDGIADEELENIAGGANGAESFKFAPTGWIVY